MTFNTVDANGTINGTVKVDAGLAHAAKPTVIKFTIAPSHGNPATFDLVWTDANTLATNINQIVADNPNS